MDLERKDLSQNVSDSLHLSPVCACTHKYKYAQAHTHLHSHSQEFLRPEFQSVEMPGNFPLLGMSWPLPHWVF